MAIHNWQRPIHKYELKLTFIFKSLEYFYWREKKEEKREEKERKKKE